MTHFDKEKADKLAAAINADFDSMKRALTNAAEHVAEAGKKLQEARDSVVPAGMWQGWVKEHCHIGPRQASNYIKLANNWHLIPDEKRASGLSIREALELIREILEPSQGDDQSEDCKVADSEESESPAPAAEAGQEQGDCSEEVIQSQLGETRDTANSQSANAVPVQPVLNREAGVQALTFAMGTLEADVFQFLLKEVRDLTKEAARNLSATLQRDDREQIADELERKLAENLRH